VPESLDQRKVLILCIEDNESHLALRRLVLEHNGYAVLSARTACQAMQILSESSVGLVISDHMLGGISGTELARDIRKLDPHLPIMLYSATVPETLGDVDCFMSKTEPAETFLSKVGDLIMRSRA
jgi:CheY-like chemotaxis protein